MDAFEDWLISVVTPEQVHACIQEMYGIVDMDALVYSILNTFYLKQFRDAVLKSCDSFKLFNDYQSYEWMKKYQVCTGRFRNVVERIASTPYTLPGNDDFEHILQFQNEVKLDFASIYSLYTSFVSGDNESDDGTPLSHKVYREYIDMIGMNVHFYDLVNEYYNKYYILKKPGALRAFIQSLEYRVLQVHPAFDHIIKKCESIDTIVRAYRSYRLRSRLPVVANKARLKDEIEYRPLTGIKYFEAKEFFEKKEWLD
jgi:hypothetical protein